MVEKRRLTNEEVDIVNTSLIRIQNQKRSCIAKIKYHTLMIEELLEVNYIEKKEEFKQNLKKIEDDLKDLNITLDVLNDQLDNGVEIKNNSEEESK